ncbi:uncharacterized protein FOBCDRAFT_232764 [Fusarium oxysporum Fo47]|uniref:uncharacterized protein n=1 Tax=Fusarium oxysporum Fo47 TaxID=660027 RepID=UPI002869A9F9|nr:uncharacterized protein FOBCDRAFT_232764 [Fusarium oxysporum Fo47]WJG37012.1 hypothetical protein FOBCDRAFT_232764 [Fusarium oxysporum Fo47]
MPGYKFIFSILAFWLLQNNFTICLSFCPVIHSVSLTCELAPFQRLPFCHRAKACRPPSAVNHGFRLFNWSTNPIDLYFTDLDICKIVQHEKLTHG